MIMNSEALTKFQNEMAELKNPVVPLTKDGTAIPARTVNEYTKDYGQLCRAHREVSTKGAEIALNMGKVVFEASCLLPPVELETFRQRLKLKGSMFSNFLRIGAHYERLMNRKEHLPASWFTLYELTFVEEERIEQAVTKGTLHP